MLDRLIQDLRFTGRTLRRSPGFTIVMVLTLALGIGANSAIFSVVQAVLLKPLPYPHADRLVAIWSSNGGPGVPARRGMPLSYPNYQDVRSLGGDFDGVGIYTETRYNLTGSGEPQEVQASLVSPDLFKVLGTRPAVGRGFGAAELRAPVVILSHGLASQLFGSNAAALGHTLILDDQGYTVVGVMPAGFAFPDNGTQLWAPVGREFLSQPEMETNRNMFAFNAVARLRNGVNLQRADADLGVLAARINATPGNAAPGRRIMRIVQGGGAAGGGGQPGQPGAASRSGASQAHGRVVEGGAASSPGGRATPERAPIVGGEGGQRIVRRSEGAQRSGGAGAPGTGEQRAGARQRRVGPGRRVAPSSQGPAPRPGGAEAEVISGGAMSTGFGVEALRDEVVGHAGTPLLILLGAVGLVLLIACVNAANLLLARAGARGRELAVRRALGAGRGRLIGQLLTESVVLALAGGVVGLVFARWGVAAIIAAWPHVLPRATAIGLDGAVLGFTFLVSVVTGLAFGLAPTLSASATPVETSLREGALAVTAGPHRHRLQHALVAAEIALALVVLTGAGLLVRSFIRLSEVNPGYDTRGVLAASIRLTPARYQNRAQALDFYKQVLDQLHRQPGVETVAMARTLPMSGGVMMISMDPRQVRPDDPDAFLAMGLGVVGPDYFRALHIPILAGRSFTADDRAGTLPVVIVNTRLAQQLWPGQDPIGKTIPMRSPGRGSTDLSVIGEIGDVHYASLADPVKPEIYMPFTQWGGSSFDRSMGAWLVARTGGNPLHLVGVLRRAVATVDPQQPIATITTMTQMVRRSTASRRLNMTLVTLFAALALGLAVIGIYGVSAYTVGQRTREIGVRMALGARDRDVARMLLRETALIALLGIGVGLAGALFATRVLASLLYGVSTTDPLTFVATAIVLAAAAILAALVPARRAARTDPVHALKYE